MQTVHYHKVNCTGMYSWSGQFALTTFQTCMNPQELFYSLWQYCIPGILIHILGYAANRNLTQLSDFYHNCSLTTIIVFLWLNCGETTMFGKSTDSYVGQLSNLALLLPVS